MGVRWGDVEVGGSRGGRRWVQGGGGERGLRERKRRKGEDRGGKVK